MVLSFTDCFVRVKIILNRFILIFLYTYHISVFLFLENTMSRYRRIGINISVCCIGAT